MIFKFKDWFRPKQSKESEKKAWQFNPAVHHAISPDLNKRFLEAAIGYLEDSSSEADEDRPDSELVFENYIGLRREDPEWEAWGFDLSLSGADGGRLPIKEWVPFLVGERSETAASAARAFSGFLNSGLAFWNEEEKVLTCPDYVISHILPASLLTVAGLSQNGDDTLSLYSSGVNFTEKFRIGFSWSRYGHPLIAAERQGMLLRTGGLETSLVGPIFFVADSLDRFSAKRYGDVVEKMAAWAGVSGLISHSPFREGLTAAGGSARLVNAAKITIEIDQNGDITPVLLRTKPKRNGGSDSTPLLTAAQMKALKKHFNSNWPVTDYVDLGARNYAILTPQVRRILKAMRTLVRGKPELKGQLVLDPVKAIRSVVEKEDGPDSPILDAIADTFIETPEFISQRVLAIGPWQPHSTPIAKPIPTSWFADGNNRYRVMVAGEWQLWTEEQIARFVDEYKKAQKNGEETLRFEGLELDLASIDFNPIYGLLKAIRKESKEGWQSEGEDGRDQRKAEEDDKSSKAQNLRYGPYIKSNLEVLEYKAETHQHPDFKLLFKGLAHGYRLYPHQEECLAWLQDLWKRGVPGGLLADDMGLGKTLQCLSFLRWLTDNYQALGSPRTALILAPLSLVKNWEEEGGKYLDGAIGEAKVLTSAQARELQKLPDQERLAEIAKWRWVIANYDAVRNYFPVFANVDWSLVVLDEAQRIKNPDSGLTECVKGLKSEFLLAMTGTPVENSFMDLWSIMDAAVPGVMASARDFQERYVKPEDVLAAGKELNDLLTGGGPVRLMLRRLKRDKLKDLPSKIEKKVERMMPPAQAQLYESILAERNTAQAVSRGGSEAFRALHQLETCSLLGVPVLDRNFSFSEREIAGSARLTAFFEILDAISEKREKVLIFLIHRQLQEKLAEAIEKRYGMADHPPALINGSMDTRRREAAVNAFMSSPDGRFDAMILSAKAAGTGLTLTKATNVIHLERWWNPAVEDQCTDRAYRIGQKRDVTVFLPIAKSDRRENTFDVMLDQVLSAKRSRSQAVLMPEDDVMTTNDLAESVLKR